MTSEVSNQDGKMLDSAATQSNEASAVATKSSGSSITARRGLVGLGVLGLTSLTLAACGSDKTKNSDKAGASGSKISTANSEADSPDSSSISAQKLPRTDAQTAQNQGEQNAGGTPSQSGSGAQATPVRQAAPSVKVGETEGDQSDMSQDTASSPELSRENTPENLPAEGTIDTSTVVAPLKDIYAQGVGNADLEAESEIAPGIVLQTSLPWHVARRASAAGTAEIAAEVEALGLEAWLDKQLDPDSIDDSVVENIIETHFSWANISAKEIRAAIGGKAWKNGVSVANAILMRARFGKRVLKESVVELLGDLVYVPIHGKAEFYASEYDQLLRKHALGRYADFLTAAIKHPALLFELDNSLSTKDRPNENLGRELLELYTVGREVYTEDDVANATVLLTGHGVNWKDSAYEFKAENHKTGAVKIVGFSDDNSSTKNVDSQVTNLVEHLAKHQGTATRIAQRIATRFVSDNPSEALVSELAQVYLDNDTRIAPVVKAAFLHKEFAASVGKKWRRPFEHITTIARAANVKSVRPRGSQKAADPASTLGFYGWLITDAGHRPRMWPTVDGYPDTADYWISTFGMLNAWNVAQHAAIGDKEEAGAETNWADLFGIKTGDNALETARRISWHLTGYAWSEAHLEPVAAILAGAADEGEAKNWKVAKEDSLPNLALQAVRLCFASPYGLLR